MPNQNLPTHPSSFWHRSLFLLKISIAKLFGAISAPFESRHIVSLTWLIKGSLWVKKWCLGVVCALSGIQWRVSLHVPPLLYWTNDFETNSALYLEWSHYSLIELILETSICHFTRIFSRCIHRVLYTQRYFSETFQEIRQDCAEIPLLTGCDVKYWRWNDK